jgi:hypothetical protein
VHGTLALALAANVIVLAIADEVASEMIFEDGAPIII